MNKTKRSTLIAVLFTAPFFLISQTGLAAEPPPPPGILESFLCTWNPGKDMDDLMAARDNLVKQSNKAGLELHNSYVWTLYKGGMPMNLIWHTGHESLDDWAAASDAGYAKRDQMEGVTERFADVATCQPAMGMVYSIFQREGAEGGGSSLVSASACTVKHGINRQDVTDLTRHINRTLSGMGDKAPIAAYLIEPMTAGPQTPDVVLFNVNENASAWAGFVGEIGSTAAGQLLLRHFNATLECDMALWGSQQVIDADG